MRVRELLAERPRALSGPEGRRDAGILLGHVLGASRAWLVAHANDRIDEAQRASFDALIARRAAGEPVAYLIGTRGFHALELEVTPKVLIPRPETELLVDLALQRIPLDSECAIADLGTGSGAVALAIANVRPRAHVVATDASEAALAVARRNVARTGVGNVSFERGDWCDALGGGEFDLIVSNPPYVADDDPHLREGDPRFEPRVALASGPDGLDAIRTIVRDAGVHLRAGGWLLLEHGFDQGASVRALLVAHGYRAVFTVRDLGDHERVTGGQTAV